MRVYVAIALVVVALFGSCDRRPAGHDPIDHNTIDQSNTAHSAAGHEMKSSAGADSAPQPLQFLDTMTVHHKGAIDMAMLAETRAAHDELKKFAEDIIEAQRSEIAEMAEIRFSLFGAAPPAINMDLPGMREGMKGMDLAKLDSLKANDFDLEFLSQMITHHEGALAMAKALPAPTLVKPATGRSGDPNRMVRLTAAIIKNQTAEIEKMRSWQQQWKK